MLNKIFMTETESVKLCTGTGLTQIVKFLLRGIVTQTLNCCFPYGLYGTASSGSKTFVQSFGLFN